MQRRPPRNALYFVALIAVAAMAGCKSSPENAAEVPADAPVRQEARVLDRVEVAGARMRRAEMERGQLAAAAKSNIAHAPPPAPASMAYAAESDADVAIAAHHAQAEPANTEKYADRTDNPVRRTSEQPVSTFSVDVDTGSYSNVRRMLREGVRPPADSVRAEEFINYFSYQHPAPANRDTPFRVTTELAPAPWNSQRQLLMIGIKGYDVSKATLPPSNLVFLIDTSGSMDSPDKLPLVKESLRQLIPQLREQDRVSMVVYAGSAGLVLPPTPGDRHEEILAALDRLQAGGSTNGGDGIRLAYAMAKQAFVKDGINRVILATDGDFNVGTVSQEALETLVGDQRKSGVALTTLGFGQDNYNDAMAERLADVGDGNHAYIDTPQEANKVLVEEMQATLLTIARDVKIQIEFNPAQVSEYRLIGYENRLLNREDFANDKIDAGDIGAGHEVTALYDITPAGSDADRLPPLRYGKEKTFANGNANELAHLRLRYKLPRADASKPIETPILRSSLTTRPSQSFRFASAVAAYADLLRGGTHIGKWDWNDVGNAARGAEGDDRYGLRKEFVDLVTRARQIVSREGRTPAIAGE
ncbi:MAG TPA: VWA domain-containing protein [Pseudoxanthomonas sp.]